MRGARDARAHASADPQRVVLTGLAYPVGDLLLVGLCIGLPAVRGTRLGGTWALILTGGLVLVGTDTVTALANRRALMLDLAPSRPGDAPDACSPEDAVDVDLADHTSRVALLADHVARHMGLSEVDVRRTRCAAELHDVGKLAIPAEILGKREQLDPQEWAFVRRHTIIGEHIAECASALAPIAPIIRSSHERWDGGGYPDGLAGDEIPLGAQIVFVCDAFDAMTSDRPYRAALPAGFALRELQLAAGTQFSPRVVEAFLACTAGDASGAQLRAA